MEFNKALWRDEDHSVLSLMLSFKSHQYDGLSVIKCMSQSVRDNVKYILQQIHPRTCICLYVFIFWIIFNDTLHFSLCTQLIWNVKCLDHQMLMLKWHFFKFYMWYNLNVCSSTLTLINSILIYNKLTQINLLRFLQQHFSIIFI